MAWTIPIDRQSSNTIVWPIWIIKGNRRNQLYGQCQLMTIVKTNTIKTHPPGSIVVTIDYWNSNCPGCAIYTYHTVAQDNSRSDWRFGQGCSIEAKCPKRPAELSCVDVIQRAEDRDVRMLDVLLLRCLASANHHVKMNLVQVSVFYAIIEERTMNFSFFILLCACDRNIHRKLVRGTSYQVRLKGSMIIENISTEIHAILSIGRGNVHLSGPTCPSLSPSI